jgi:hypothetical protein
MWVISEVLHTVCFLFKKMNLFYKIHLQAVSVISIVLYHSGPMFGQVLYSCLDAFIVDASDYSGHLIRQLLNASEVFPTERFLQFWEQVNFMHNIFLVYSINLYMFGAYLGPSSGGITICIQQLGRRNTRNM